MTVVCAHSSDCVGLSVVWQIDFGPEPNDWVTFNAITSSNKGNGESALNSLFLSYTLHSTYTLVNMKCAVLGLLS